MKLTLYDVYQATFSASVGVPQGPGQFTAPTGSVAPGLIGPTIEPVDRTVNDNTTAAAAVKGKLLVQQYLAANTGGANFVQNTVAAAALAWGAYGIVYSPASQSYNYTGTGGGPANPALGNNATMRVSGMILALCITGTTAIAPGTVLVSDAAGNLTAPAAAPTAAGTGLAVAMGTLAASTATPTLVLVYIGGY